MFTAPTNTRRSTRSAPHTASRSGISNAHLTGPRSKEDILGGDPRTETVLYIGSNTDAANRLKGELFQLEEGIDMAKRVVADEQKHLAERKTYPLQQLNLVNKEKDMLGLRPEWDPIEPATDADGATIATSPGP